MLSIREGKELHCTAVAASAEEHRVQERSFLLSLAELGEVRVAGQEPLTFLPSLLSCQPDKMTTKSKSLSLFHFLESISQTPHPPTPHPPQNALEGASFLPSNLLIMCVKGNF